MKRKRLWIGVLLAASLLAGGGAFLLWPRDRITRVSFEKIDIGIAEKEVEALLGGPGINRKWAEFWPFKNVNVQNIEFEARHWISVEDFTIWEGRRGIIGLQFDPAGKVSGKLRIMKTDRNILERLRDWLTW